MQIFNKRLDSKMIIALVQSESYETAVLSRNENQSLINFQKEIKKGFYDIIKNSFKHYPPSKIERELQTLKIKELKFI